jgi:hypothetical protein
MKARERKKSAGLSEWTRLDKSSIRRRRKTGLGAPKPSKSGIGDRGSIARSLVEAGNTTFAVRARGLAKFEKGTRKGGAADVARLLATDRRVGFWNSGGCPREARLLPHLSGSN